MNRKISSLIVFCLFFAGTGLSRESADSLAGTSKTNPGNITKIQQQLSAAELQREAMNKVGFLAGRWEGTEWVLMQNGQKQNCLASDFAETKLNGTLILFQGGVKVRISPETDPFVVYEGLGILSYDESSQKYHLQHFGTDGAYAAYEGTLSGRSLQCERRDKDNAIVRVTIEVDDDGRWVEKGERSQDGKTWTETFGTQMSKVMVVPK